MPNSGGQIGVGSLSVVSDLPEGRDLDTEVQLFPSVVTRHDRDPPDEPRC
jgi:hypothetical protein